MLRRISEGVPPLLAARAAALDWETIKEEPDVVIAIAEGEIRLFEIVRDGSATGSIRSAQRHEANTWQPKAEVTLGVSLEDLLRD